MTAYYNEIDPKAAAWLRELIKQGHIAKGEVDERSILEVQPDDLRGFTQCHFFAGIGVWSYALRLAGWPDDRPVWTGSCPCQPFSSAGKGDEFADERHLWPAWFRLARELRPDTIFGEQVSSKDALSWFDHVRVDLEGEGYAIGVLDTCAAGVGAPHIRQRLYFVADGTTANAKRDGGRADQSERETQGRVVDGRDSPVGFVAESSGARVRDIRPGTNAGAPGGSEGEGHQRQRLRDDAGHDRSIAAGELADPNGQQRERTAERTESSGRPGFAHAGAVNGFWSNTEWIPCRDGKARPTEPGTFSLVTGAPARVVRLRGYGNAINAQQARNFIESYIEVRAGT